MCKENCGRKSRHGHALFTNAVTLQRMTSVYASVCPYAPIRSHTQIYVRGTCTLGIRRVHSKYAHIRRCTLCYAQSRNDLLDMFKNYQRMRAYSIYVTHTLDIRYAYARHTFNTLKVRYSYVSRTLSIRYSYDC